MADTFDSHLRYTYKPFIPMSVDLTATILTLKHLLISIHIISMIRKRNSYLKNRINLQHYGRY